MGTSRQATVSLRFCSQEGPSNCGRDEHYKRSPDCPFFALSNEYNKQGSARKSKAKKDRSSKASRLSTQSTFTTTSDVASLADLPADDDDSILTTATNATATPATKKMDKRKRTTTGRSRKTKAKKSEAVEVPHPAEFKDNDVEVLEQPAPKSTRGRKRKSSQIQDSGRDDVEAEAPAAKRRTTQTRQSSAIEDAALITEASAEQAFTDEPPTSTEPSRAKRVGRPSRKPSARKPSARKPSARVASRKVPAPRVLTDEEIDAALQADLDKHASEDEEISIVKKATRSGKNVNAEYAMFNPEPMDIDEDVIDAELEAMEAEAKPSIKPKAPRGRPRKASAKQTAAAKKAAEAEAEAREAADELAADQITSELELSISMQHSPPALKPKKQRAASRKVSEQAPAQNSNSSLLSSHDSSIIQPDDLQTSVIHQNIQHEPTEDFGNDTNLSMASQSTVVRSSTSTLRGSTIKKRGRPSKHRIASRNIEAILRPSQNSPSNEDKIDELQAAAKEESLDETSMAEERFYTPAPEFRPEEEKRVSDVNRAQPPKPRGRPPKISREPLTIASATPPQRQGKRSQSPQSSDIENQPPSSKPSTVKKSVTPKATSTRVPLSAATLALSPSKLNVISSLRSSNPWTVVDLDAIFLKTPGDENAIDKGLLDDAISKVKNSELTSPEKKMTVEEWIVYNGRVAEENLRNECERMVGTFEREGTRAMAALEGVECTE